MSPLRRLQALEQQRRQLFERLENIDPDLLNRRPAEGRWSMIQVACHRVGAEKLTLSYIQRKVDNPEGLPDVTASGWLRLVTLAIALRSPLRFEAPGRSGDVPEREDPAETRRRWDEVRSRWRELVERFPPELKRKGVFRHPFAGRMTLSQALGFTAEHFRHHEKQIEATRATLTARSTQALHRR